MMRITTLASGSSGNCALISSGDTHILVDAGISMRRIKTGLAAMGLQPEHLSGVFITHEHSDHVSGLPMLIKHHGIKIFSPHTVASRLRGMLPDIDPFLEIIHIGEPVCLGDMRVTAFHTLHDTDESVGYRIDGEVSLGFCTDLGRVTDEVREALRGVCAAVIESNHDENMLRDGGYPIYLKRRILSERGHLSNESCGELAAFLAENGAETLVLSHLSRENNTPARALAGVGSALLRAGQSAELLIAPPLGNLTVEACAPCLL
ncbi:MAG: MBL fold metallo-hydrolase [Oscillospiraceae bacterium]